MVKYYILSVFTAIFLLSGCNSDSPLTNEETQTGDYSKIFTSESGGNKFEVWSASSSNLRYGYNKIGFKVFSGNTEKNTGYVKYTPTMYHGLNGPSHSVPVSENFTYNNESSLFTGYAVFIMYDETAFWAADYNYNNEFSVDSSVFTLFPYSQAQVSGWDNSSTQRTYMLTLISPLAPRVGLNPVELMLHETTDMLTYSEVQNAEMFIKPWMEAMGHGSGNNVNPVWNAGDKMFKGTANFTMAGEWYLYDSIKVGSTFITGTPPPKFILEIN